MGQTFLSAESNEHVWQTGMSAPPRNSMSALRPFSFDAQLFFHDFQIVAVMLHRLAGAEVEDRVAVGLPVVEIEAEDCGAGLEVADGIGHAARRAGRGLRGDRHRHKCRKLAGGSAADVGHVVVKDAVGPLRGIGRCVGGGQLNELRLEPLALNVESPLGLGQRRRLAGLRGRVSHTALPSASKITATIGSHQSKVMGESLAGKARRRRRQVSSVIVYNNPQQLQIGRSRGQENCKVLRSTAILAVTHGQDARATTEFSTLQFSCSRGGLTPLVFAPSLCYRDEMAILGAHRSIAGGYEKAVERARLCGCDCVQLFTKNNSRWAGGDITAEEARKFSQALDRFGIIDPLAHDSYLINLASPGPLLWRRSVDAFVAELHRAEILGIPHVVAHPGDFTTADEAAGLRNIVRALDEVAERTRGLKARCLLETTAGQGTALGWRFEHFAAILDGVKQPERLGFCFDTCHVFAAGYPLATSGRVSSDDGGVRPVGRARSDTGLSPQRQPPRAGQPHRPSRAHRPRPARP